VLGTNYLKYLNIATDWFEMFNGCHLHTSASVPTMTHNTALPTKSNISATLNSLQVQHEHTVANTASHTNISLTNNKINRMKCSYSNLFSTEIN